MTDSDGENTLNRKEVEQRLLQLLDTNESTTIQAALEHIFPHGVSVDEATQHRLLRTLHSIPSVEVVTDPLRGQSVIRRVMQPQRAGVAMGSKDSKDLAGGAAGRRPGAAGRPLDRPIKKKGSTRQPELGATHQQAGRVGYVCVADEFNLEELCTYYTQQGYHTTLAFDVLHVSPKQQVPPSPTHTAAGLSRRGPTPGYGATGQTAAAPTPPAPGGSTYSPHQVDFDMFLFDYGVVVWWGTHQKAFRIVENDFIYPQSKLNKYLVNRCPTLLINENFPVWCTYAIDPLEDFEEPNQAFADRLKYDHFLLPNESPDVKLCISHALGQSGKIDYLELKVEDLTHQCKPLPRELREKGSCSISERRLLQLRGEVLFFRLMLKSGSDLLDEPTLFWEHPWLKPVYIEVKEAFQVSERVDILDAKLDTANEILSMINDQFNQRRGSRLEWIVIWLVGVEVIIGVLELLVDARPWLVGPSALK